MNYLRIYDSLIARGRNRDLQGYYETHHIVPKCLGGSDDISNLVRLTPEEHYLCHQLLVKIYPHNAKLVYAALIMTSSRPSNKLYGWIRRKVAKSMSISQTGSGNSQYGKVWITNGSKNMKHLKDMDLPNGWKYGASYPPVFGKLDICGNCRRSQLSQDNERKAREWFEALQKSNASSISEFLKTSTYPHSKVSFIKMLKTYIPDFRPEHGKRYLGGSEGNRTL